ncbi:MAG: rod-binding protein [Alphaproteobacteria bacterium]|jgi:flagellar protein FlgJ|nr:rod-binding protein [Alphaproteobacteria bacterium]MBF0356005.1 rod-binding protein [Alphaproteobacteria bacterium]
MSAQAAFDSLSASANLGLEQARSQRPAVNQGKVSPEQIKKTALEFETHFMAEMYKHMFEGVGTDEVFGGGAGEETFRSFMVDEYAKLTAKTGRIGLARQIEEHMLKMQEVRS